MRHLLLALFAVVFVAGCGPAPGKADRTESKDSKDKDANAKPSLIGTWVTEKPNPDGSTTTIVIGEGRELTETVKMPGKGEITYTSKYEKISDKKIEVYEQQAEGKNGEKIPVPNYKVQWIDAKTMDCILVQDKSTIRFIRK